MTEVAAVMAGILGAGAAVAALIAAFWKFGRWIRGIARNVENFLDDWRGEPARPGVPATPGVMERLASVATREDVDRLNDRVDGMELEVRELRTVMPQVSRLDGAVTVSPPQ